MAATAHSCKNIVVFIIIGIIIIIINIIVVIVTFIVICDEYVRFGLH